MAFSCPGSRAASGVHAAPGPEPRAIIAYPPCHLKRHRARLRGGLRWCAGILDRCRSFDTQRRESISAQPTLDANVCTYNAQAGIGYSDTARGVARANECVGNRWGIYVAETADPDLNDNDCRDNTAEGILDLRP